MKVNELRQLLNKKSTDEKRELIVEFNKLVPKAVKEERAIDAMVTDYAAWKGQKPVAAGGKIVIDKDTIDAFWEDFSTFDYHVRASNYFAPNRYIHKNERSKWRFKVKNYLKFIDVSPAHGPFAEDGLKLISSLFELLLMATHVYLFPSDQHFSAIGRYPSDFFQNYTERTFFDGINEEKVRAWLAYATTCFAYSSGIASAELAQTFKTAPPKELVAKISHKIRRDLYKEPVLMFDGRAAKPYYHDQAIWGLFCLYMHLKIDLGEVDDVCLEFYRMATRNKKTGIVFYQLMHQIGKRKDDALWIKVYKSLEDKMPKDSRLVREHEIRLARLEGREPELIEIDDEDDRFAGLSSIFFMS